ncbi:MAG TPA: hypothetical protein VKB49_08240 [Candidatus Sulfotelmatobacter sp.]|nr:hypothetical protein [Candidatus Sulfotelmatobacter sp.]
MNQLVPVVPILRVVPIFSMRFIAQTKLSKLDLVRYYLSVVPGALAGIRDLRWFPSASSTSLTEKSSRC